MENSRILVFNFSYILLIWYILFLISGEDLVLAAPLDKENIKGVDSILIDVVCQRQRSSDPSFSIPVHVRVTDVNDNAPLFIGAPFNLSLSEMTVVGSRILTASSTGEFLQKWWHWQKLAMIRNEYLRNSLKFPVYLCANKNTFYYLENENSQVKTENTNSFFYEWVFTKMIGNRYICRKFEHWKNCQENKCSNFHNKDGQNNLPITNDNVGLV